MGKIIKYAVIGFIALIVLAAVFGGDDAKEEKAKSGSGETASEEVKVEAIVVKASELVKAYKKNEIAADKQYKDKTLEVTAIIESIDSDFSDDAVLTLKGANYTTVHATGADDSFTDKAAELEAGQEIKLMCIGGGETIGMPSLKDCVIQ